MIKRVLAASAALVLSAALANAQEVKIGLVAPFTEAVSVTGAEPEALKPSVAHSPRSPMPPWPRAQPS